MDSKLNCNAICFLSIKHTETKLLVDRRSVKFESNREYYINLNFFVSCMSSLFTSQHNSYTDNAFYSYTLAPCRLMIYSLCVYPHRLPTSTHAAHLIRVRLVLVYTLENELSSKQWTHSWISNIFNRVFTLANCSISSTSTVCQHKTALWMMNGQCCYKIVIYGQTCFQICKRLYYFKRMTI